MREFTFDKQIEICNSVNLALVKGKTVKVNNRVINGIIILKGKIRALVDIDIAELLEMHGLLIDLDNYHFFMYKNGIKDITGMFTIFPKDRIAIVHTAEIVDVIYEPIVELHGFHPTKTGTEKNFGIL